MHYLIKALTILSKYLSEDNISYPTHCEHDVLMVPNVKPEDVSEEDLKELEKLGFEPDKDLGYGFSSFRFGSC